MCVELPACGNAEDECDAGSWAERTDSLGPATNRWYCRAAGESEACRDPAPPPHCGTNEEYDLDGSDELTCVCESGYHLHGGKCVQDPMCSDPLVENKCKVGTATGSTDTAVYGACETTEAEGCVSPRGGTFKDAPNTPKADGKCGTAKNECVSGTTDSEAETTSRYTWDCLGIAGSKNWSCLGSAGRKEWDCENGDPNKTQSCGLPSPGSSRSCRERITEVDYLGCYVCKPGYEDVNGDCVKECKPNEVRDTNGNCVCKSGFDEVGETCMEVVKLEVNPVPTKCHITAPVGVAARETKADGISCGYNGTNCIEYYVTGTSVTLTKTDKSGYACIWRGSCTGTSPTCTLRMDRSKEVSASGRTTLEVDPGGDNGAYTSTYVRFRLPPPSLGWHVFYSAMATATATGGVPVYSFQWHGSTKAGASATFVYLTPPAGAKEMVTVTDADDETDTATAIINSPAASDAAQDGGAEPFAFEVPPGGERYFVWGGGGEVTAKSGDQSVVVVSVASPGIRVSGVGVGETLVEVSTDEGKLYLPMVVR